MATIDDLRTRLRVRLEETTAAVWIDDELDACLSGALDDYGRRFFHQATASAVVADGAMTVPVPEGAIGVRRVILDDGYIIPRRMTASRQTTGEELAWEVHGAQLHFTQPLAAQTLTIWHTAPVTFATLPAADDELVLLGAIAGALEARAIQDFKRGGGTLGGEVVERARQAADRAMAQRQRWVVSGSVAAG